MNRRIFCKSNGFTLIELLVVVAIIGILAAVGVVAYSGYTSAAKIRVVKANHKIVSNWIIHEVAKCDIMQDPMYVILKGNAASGRYCKDIDAFTVASFVTSNSGVLRDKISNPYPNSLGGYAGKYNTIKFGYATKESIIETHLGVIFIETFDDDGNKAFFADATRIQITSCNKIPCNPATGEGYMKTSFEVESRR